MRDENTFKTIFFKGICVSHAQTPLVFLLTVVKTYTPLLSLDYVKTTSSPPSTTHIITDDETSIPSSTTETGFSTQDITTATSRGSADTSVVVCY